MKLSCHCRNIELIVSNKPTQLTECNCSICRRYAALWGYYTPKEVEVTINRQPPLEYTQDEGALTVKICSQCGCVCHYETLKEITPAKVGINFRMAENIEELKDIDVRSFDGANLL
ncbi:GFA family protein [Aliikangiella maris]|uniref:Aldehyde-activating protein n=2 Tax=Aliikangiella maris TaxID=3162458 RepID=A0ABV3MQD8_9GAMM